jgi:hypothetical protein
MSVKGKITITTKKYQQVFLGLLCSASPCTLTGRFLSFLLLLSLITGLTVFFGSAMLLAHGTTSFQTGMYKVTSETVNIGPNVLYYYYFYANSPADNIHLIGQYQELGGNDMMVTIYDDSSCSTPYGSVGFDVRTCTTLDSNIYNEIQPAGAIDLPLSPGNYFLTLESANYNDATVYVNFDVIYNFPSNMEPQLDDGISNGVGVDESIDDGGEEDGNDGEGGCVQGPGGCGGAFDLGGFGPFSPLNPNFGR